MNDEEKLEEEIRQDREAEGKAAYDRARAWLAAYIKTHGIDYEALTLGQRTLLTRSIPCPIWCWRVGGPVEVLANEKCPECGKTYRVSTFDRLAGPDAF